MCSTCYFESRHGSFRAHYDSLDPQEKKIIRDRMRANARQARLEALEHYGNACACCGERNQEFLGIDHIFGGGNKHRKEIGGNVAQWLKKNNYPAGFRILCHNCNMARAFYGYCPHQQINEKGDSTL